MDNNPVVGPVNPGPVNPVPEPPVENKKSVWQFFFSSRNRTMGTIAIILLVIAIPLTVIESQRQQQTKQEASVNCSAAGGMSQAEALAKQEANRQAGISSHVVINPIVIEKEPENKVEDYRLANAQEVLENCQFGVEVNPPSSNEPVKPPLELERIDTSANPDGADVHSSCLSAGKNCYRDSQCCSKKCTVSSASREGRGTCAATSTPTPTPTPTRTLTPTPTPTGAPGNMTLVFNLGLDGIGAAGDHKKPCTSLSNCESNKNPKTSSRSLTVLLIDQSLATKTATATIAYASSSGIFTGTASVSLVAGNYTVKVKSPGFLTKTLVNIKSLVLGENQIPSANLTNGDIDNDNQLTVLDYGILISCSIYSNDAKASCNKNAEYKKVSDLNDDGTIDLVDYNLFLREYSVQNGD